MRAVAGSGVACRAARVRSMRCRRSGSRPCSTSHLAVFSVPIPSPAARTSAAAADGARPTTLPGPCSASQAVRRAARVWVLPLPAGDQDVDDPAGHSDGGDGCVLVVVQVVVRGGRVQRRPGEGGSGPVVAGGQEPGFGVEELP